MIAHGTSDKGYIAGNYNDGATSPPKAPPPIVPSLNDESSSLLSQWNVF